MTNPEEKREATVFIKRTTKKSKRQLIPQPLPKNKPRQKEATTIV
jgi:hypothetical protein